MSEISLFQAERIASVAIVSDERSGTAAQFAHYHAATAIVCHFGPLPITTGCAVDHGVVEVDAPGGIGDRPGAGSGRSEDLQGKCRAVTAPIGMANDRQLEHLRTPAPPGAAAADHGAAPAPAGRPGDKRLQRLAVLLRKAFGYGPLARGDWDGCSDTDLLVVAANQDAAERAADQQMEALVGDDVLAIDQERCQAMARSPSPHWRDDAPADAQLRSMASHWGRNLTRPVPVAARRWH